MGQKGIYTFCLIPSGAIGDILPGRLYCQLTLFSQSLQTNLRIILDTTGKTGWNDTMQTNDKYRRDSLDGGTTWGTAYQFRGTDGQNGMNGTVDYNKVNQILKETYGITETYITEGKIGSPVIQGAEIYGGKIYAGDGSSSYAKMDGGGFHLFDPESSFSSFLSIEYTQQGLGGFPGTVFSSPAGAGAMLYFPELFISTNTLNLQGVGEILWPNGQPTAVFA